MKTTSMIGWTAHKPADWDTMTPDDRSAWIYLHCISVKFGIGHYSLQTCIKRAVKAGIVRGCTVTYRTWQSNRVRHEERHEIADEDLVG